MLQKEARFAFADSSAYSVRAGDPLIFVLPDSVGSVPVVTYSNLRVPAKSWRRDRAFFWQTGTDDEGQHRLLFSARRRDGSADTLTIFVRVTP